MQIMVSTKTQGGAKNGIVYMGKIIEIEINCCVFIFCLVILYLY